MSLPDPPAQNKLAPEDRLLCLTVLGYRKAGMDEEAYRKHMTEVSAPLTKDLLVKYGILRWTQVKHLIHNFETPSLSRLPTIQVSIPRTDSIAIGVDPQPHDHPPTHAPDHGPPDGQHSRL